MAAVATASDPSDLIQKLSLDPKTKVAEVSEVKEKPSVNTNVSVNGGSLPSPAVSSSDRSVTPLLQEASMYYMNAGYPTATYYYGGYGGWENYPTYMSNDGVETPTSGLYGDMYQQVYSYPYAPYPSSSPVPSLGHDSYGSQNYQYQPSYHQTGSKAFHTGKGDKPTSVSQVEVSTSTAADQPTIPADPTKTNSNGADSIKSAKRGSLPLKQNQSSTPSNGFYAQSGGWSSSYQNQGSRSTYPWVNGQFFSDKQQRTFTSNATSTASYAKSRGNSKSQSQRPFSPLMSLAGNTTAMGPLAPGIMNSMYSSNGIYGHGGNAFRPGLSYGSPLYGSGLYGGWNTLSDGKFKPRGRGTGPHYFGNENLDGLNELKRGPRNGFSKIQAFGSTGATAVKSPELPANKIKGANAVTNDQYNQEDFVETYMDAKFFIIKSYSEDDIHKSIKYNVWASTPNGNKKLDNAYQDAKEKSAACPMFLFFSVNTSGQFVGLAEMVGRVDFNKTVEYWQQDKWTGCFQVKWHVVKDVPNNLLKHIILENNENKPVTNSRDTQEVKLEQGLQMLKIFKYNVCKTSILDDFCFYDTREKVMQERKAKQQQLLKKVTDGKPVNGTDGEKDGLTGKSRLQKLIEVDAVSKEPAQGAVGEQKPINENGAAAVAVNGIASKESKPVTEKMAVPKEIANGC